jgi:cell fate regulator YaaT (PSP1 superfamily)
MPTLQLDLMPLEEKILEAPPPKTIVVRYGFLREIGEFASDLTNKVGCGTKLILRTDRGTEIGEMLTTTCGNGGCNKSITREKMLAYIENSGGRDYPFSEEGRVLRVATAQDLAEQAKLDENHQKHLTMARELVQTHRLAMKNGDVEYLLGGERVLFYFVSEHRVDFRSLVRDMAHHLHTRIELRQVGARDEARLTADYEKCGQHCCCKQFLKVLTPISMRAAKVQKATLDPTKISGRCGRLMCCLRYEDQTYEELRKKLPKRNTRVKTEAGDAWVIDGQILTQLVLVQYDDNKREAVPMEKILEFDRPKPVTPEGRTIQTPHDRPPQAMPERRSGPHARNAPPAPQRRPQPGVPLPDEHPDADPRAISGPTGGDLNSGAPSVPPDEIDDLIADAMDSVAPRAPAPSPAPKPLPRPIQGRPNQRPRSPQNTGPRPPQQQQRPPQAFRPPPPRPQPQRPEVVPPPPPTSDGLPPAASSSPPGESQQTPPPAPPAASDPGGNPA